MSKKARNDHWSPRAFGAFRGRGFRVSSIFWVSRISRPHRSHYVDRTVGRLRVVVGVSSNRVGILALKFFVCPGMTDPTSLLEAKYSLLECVNCPDPG